MPKSVKAKCDFGINSIMDQVMIPDGFARVCDGLDLRSGVARVWNAPAKYRPVIDSSSNHIWEYRGKWYESVLDRTYHGEYMYAQESVFFTEEGPGHLPPQKIVDGIQARLGTMRPTAEPTVTYIDSMYPVSISVMVSGSGGVPIGVASYRIAAIKNSTILHPSGPVKVQLTQASTVLITWREVPDVEGYAIFGRTAGNEKLLAKVGNTTSWSDEGTSAESTPTAASLETASSYQYVYTYFRKVGNVEDESGPSPLSMPTDPTKIPCVTRIPDYDGFFSEDTKTYSSSINSVSCARAANTDSIITCTLPRADGTQTMITTSAAHGIVVQQNGYILNSSIDSGGGEFNALVPIALSSPSASFNALQAGGTLSVGTHKYKVTSARGIDDKSYGSNVYGNPAQTLPCEEITVVTTSGNQSVRISFDSYSSGTDSFIVYRDGVAVAVCAITLASWLDDGSATQIDGFSIPASNETSTRCLAAPKRTIKISNATTKFVQSKTNVTLSGQNDFHPSINDVVLFSGSNNFPELNGMATVLAYSNGVVTIDKVLKSPPSTESAGLVLKWRPYNGYYQGWRLYRVGDTSEFLRVAELPIGTTNYVDTLSVNDLGIAIPTAYSVNGAQVVYDRAPANLKRMVSHLGMRFGIVDDLVRWTPTEQPDAWPDSYYAAFPSKPVALASFKGILSVVCEDGLYGLIGNTPATLSPAGPFSNLGCIAPFTVQASNHGLLWLSKVGIAVSLDGMSATCLTGERVPGRYFYAPSTASGEVNPPIGYGWFIPTQQSVQFAESMREEGIDATLYPVSQVSYDSPINAQITDIKSFYWDNRYFLYYVGSKNYARSACICVDMLYQHMPITTLPINPKHVHVSLGGECYMLLQPRAVTDVTITTPSGSSASSPTVFTCVPHTIGYAGSDHTVVWAFDDATTLDGQSVTKTWGSTGLHTVAAIVTNKITGVTVTATKTITIV